MKTIHTFRKILLLFGLAGAFAACDDDNSPVYNPTADPQMDPLVSSAITLNQEAASFIAEVFSWSEGSYGFTAAPTFSLQMDETNTFPDPVILGDANQSYLPVTVEKLNMGALILGATETTPKDMYIRVEARLTNDVLRYSDAVTLTVTPYDQVIVYPKLYMPGSYQGWNPASAAILTSWRLNNKFEATVDLVNSDAPSDPITFKLLTAPAWGSGTEYGSGGAPGTLKEKGGDISISPQGKYKMVVNLNTMTYTATLVSE